MQPMVSVLKQLNLHTPTQQRSGYVHRQCSTMLAACAAASAAVHVHRVVINDPPSSQTNRIHYSPNSNPSTPRTCPSIGLGRNPVPRLYVPSTEVHSTSQHTKNMCTRKTSTCRKNTKNCLTASTRRALNAVQLTCHPCGAGCKPPCRAHLEMHQWTVACPSIIDPEPRTNAATAVWQGAPCAQT